jgi:hypothetical protein
VEGNEPFCDHFFSIIQAAAGLASVQKSLNHYLVPDFDVDKEKNFNFVSNYFFPWLDVFLVPGEAIYHHDFLWA